MKFGTNKTSIENAWTPSGVGIKEHVWNIFIAESREGKRRVHFFPILYREVVYYPERRL
jgi:hypothetical protein